MTSEDIDKSLQRQRAELVEQQANTIRMLLNANELHLKTIQVHQETIERLIRALDRPSTVIPCAPFPPNPFQPSNPIYFQSPIICSAATPTDGSGATVSNHTP